MNFVFIFAAKLAINNDMSKDFFKELTPVAIRDYYKSLSKKDKGNFLQFLVANCDGSNNIVVFLTIQYYCLPLRHE